MCCHLSLGIEVHLALFYTVIVVLEVTEVILIHHCTVKKKKKKKKNSLALHPLAWDSALTL